MIGKPDRADDLLGEDQHGSGILTVKNFATGEQTKIPRGEIVSALQTR